MIYLLAEFIFFAFVFAYDFIELKLVNNNGVKRILENKSKKAIGKYFESVENNSTQALFIGNKMKNHQTEKVKYAEKNNKEWAMNGALNNAKKKVDEEVKMFEFKYNVL
jgi:hypothetical protein